MRLALFHELILNRKRVEKAISAGTNQQEKDKFSPLWHDVMWLAAWAPALVSWSDGLPPGIIFQINPCPLTCFVGGYFVTATEMKLWQAINSDGSQCLSMSSLPFLQPSHMVLSPWLQISSPTQAMSSWEAGPCTSHPSPQSSGVNEINFFCLERSPVSMSTSCKSKTSKIFANQSLAKTLTAAWNRASTLLVYVQGTPSHSPCQLPTCLKHSAYDVYYQRVQYCYW